MAQGIFTLRDLYEQLRTMTKMGPISQMMNMLPGMNSMLAGQGMQIDDQLASKRLQVFMTVMDSMTDGELDAEIGWVFFDRDGQHDRRGAGRGDRVKFFDRHGQHDRRGAGRGDRVKFFDRHGQHDRRGAGRGDRVKGFAVLFFFDDHIWFI